VLKRTDLVFGSVPLYTPDPDQKYDFRTRTSFDPDKGQQLEHKGAALNLGWKLSDRWNLRSISAFRKLDSRSYIDIDASQFELGDVLVDFHQKQASQELQLQYDNGSNLQAVYGLYWLRETVPSHQEAYASDLFALAGTPITFLRTIDDDLTTTTYAGFAHVNWEFVPSWTLAAGVRYSSDHKDYDRTTSTFWGAPFSAINETVAFSANKRWNAWTPTLSLQKQLDPQTMLYASASRGFKSGGFNGRANTAAETKSAEYSPEYVWTYELGMKWRSADNKLQANLAAFHSDYTDFQARVSEVQNPGSITPTFAFPVINAAKLKMDGIEFEGAAVLGQGTRLSAQVGYMDARYAKFVDHRLDPSDPLYNPELHKHVPFSPTWTSRVAATQAFDLGDGSAITIGADWSYRSETWLSVDNYEALSQKAYSVTGLFGIYDSADGHWQFRAGVRNLGDKVYKTDGQEFSSVGNIRTAYYGMPRNWYANVRYNF
jgi:iron complex outermembrane recepter protein